MAEKNSLNQTFAHIQSVVEMFWIIFRQDEEPGTNQLLIARPADYK